MPEREARHSGFVGNGANGNLDEEQKVLAELIGLEAFKSLVRAFNGTSIYIPKIESLEKQFVTN